LQDPSLWSRGRRFLFIKNENYILFLFSVYFFGLSTKFGLSIPRPLNLDGHSVNRSLEPAHFCPGVLGQHHRVRMKVLREMLQIEFCTVQHSFMSKHLHRFALYAARHRRCSGLFKDTQTRHNLSPSPFRAISPLASQDLRGLTPSGSGKAG
jgi:hypothetical protein